MNRAEQIKTCLDEIEAAYAIMLKPKSDAIIQRMCRGWVRKHNGILKELKYRGKIPRRKRHE